MSIDIKILFLRGSVTIEPSGSLFKTWYHELFDPSNSMAFCVAMVDFLATYNRLWAETGFKTSYGCRKINSFRNCFCRLHQVSSYGNRVQELQLKNKRTGFAQRKFLTTVSRNFFPNTSAIPPAGFPRVVRLNHFPNPCNFCNCCFIPHNTST